MTMTSLPNLFTIFHCFRFQSSLIIPGSQVAGTLGELHSASPIPSSGIWYNWRYLEQRKTTALPSGQLNWRNHVLVF